MSAYFMQYCFLGKLILFQGFLGISSEELGSYLIRNKI